MVMSASYLGEEEEGGSHLVKDSLYGNMTFELNSQQQGTPVMGS
jgi:hypothetical protein